MKRSLLIVALLAAYSLSFAQIKFKPGYILNTKNDTLKGYIEYREHWNNAKTFTFKATLNSQPEKYSVDNANAVGITGFDNYEKFITSVSKGYVDIPRLTDAVDSTYAIDTVFLRVVKKGKNVSLYSYTDNIKTRYYILNSADGKITELKYFVYLAPETRIVTTVASYHWQLISIANTYWPNNQKLTGQIKSAEYNEVDLFKVVQLINGTNDKQVVNSGAAASRFFIGAGVKNSKVTFTGQDFAFNSGINASKTSPTITAGVDYVLNKETEKVILRAEVGFVSNEFNIPDQDVAGSGNGLIANLNFKQTTISIAPQVIYNFYSTSALKVFIDAGASINFSSYNDYNYNFHYSVSTQKGVKNKYPIFESTWFTIPIKAGVVVGKHIELYAAYYTSGSITKYKEGSAGISAYQGGVNFLF